MLVEETPPIEIPEPTPKDLPPSRPVHKATPTPHDSNEKPTDPVAELIGKFVRSAIARVAEAREVPIPSEDLAHFIQEEDPTITMTSLFEQIIATRTSNNLASEQFLGHSKDLTRMWTRRIAYPLTSWSQALDDYRNRSESEISYWPNQDVFYPLPIAVLAEGSNPETKDLFKNDALEEIGRASCRERVSPYV